MQTLWIYIDDIIGKGAGFGMIVEFIFYRSMSLFPMALPIAVLLSSVMIMGNLAERYELASMKSAGLPLLRIMQPLVFACMGVACFSWVCSNYLIPHANLKFKSRLYDMRKQKPTLNLEEGVFNEDFDGYRIRIGEKAPDNRMIKNIFIANHSTSQKNDLYEIIAANGEMYMTENGQFMVMELNEGEQFQEGDRFASGATAKAPFVRTSFKKYTKVFDLNEFDMNRTDEEAFQNHYSMKSMQELGVAIDSIDVQLTNRKDRLSDYFDNYFPVIADSSKQEKKDTIPEDEDMQAFIKERGSAKESVKVKVSTKTKINTTINKKLLPSKKISATPKKNLQNITKDLKEYGSLIETFPEYKQPIIVDKSIQIGRNIKSNADSADKYMERTKEKKVKHIFELYSKYAYAVVCIVFLFIGAPMGALVRKGGFGYPLLIAIICFMLYIVLTMMFKDMAEAFAINAFLAVWMPNLILLPIGMFLTYKAMNDSKMLEMDRLFNLFRKIFELLTVRSSAKEIK